MPTRPYHLQVTLEQHGLELHSLFIGRFFSTVNTTLLHDLRLIKSSWIGRNYVLGGPSLSSSPCVVQGSTAITMATIAGDFSMCQGTVLVPEGHISTPHLVPSIPLWGKSYYCFADEEMGSGGSSNLLRSNSQQMVEPEIQLKQFSARVWAFNEKKQRMLWSCYPKGNIAFLTEVEYVLFAPFLGELTPTWTICSPQQHLFWFSKDMDSLCGDALCGKPKFLIASGIDHTATYSVVDEVINQVIKITSIFDHFTFLCMLPGAYKALSSLGLVCRSGIAQP